MKRALKVLLVLALGAGSAALPACVEESPELTATERESLREYILSERPRPQHALDVQFENKVRLIGYDIDVDTITPGQPFTITWYWQVERRLGGGWLQFTHLADAAGTDRLNQDSNGVIRERYQAGRWRANEYIRDAQTITIGPDWGSDRVVFYLGFWHEAHRLQVSSGPSDGDNRVRAASVPVASVAAGTTPTTIVSPDRPTPTLPTLDARRVAGSLTIDGRLDEADWAAVTPTSAFVNTITGGAAEPTSTARVLWDDAALYIGFDVADDFLQNTLSGRDAHLWGQDCVEVMVDPDGDGANYFELQVSPTGEIFDTFYDSRRVPQPIGHADWNARIETRVATRGTANDDTDDQGYSVEMRIPWASFQHGSSAQMGTPLAGSTWRMNFYVMDTRRGGSQRAVGWSPPLEGDFHVPARFGRVRLGAPAAAAPTPTVTPTAAAPNPDIDGVPGGYGVQARLPEGMRPLLRDLQVRAVRETALPPAEPPQVH